MSINGKSPYRWSPLPGVVSTYGDMCPLASIVSANRNHNQESYNPPDHHKRRIPFLEKAKVLIEDALSNPFDYALAHLFWHKDKLNKRGGYRKVRSERRTSITLRIGQFIMHHVSLAMFTLGYYKHGKFHYYGYEAIAKAISINISEVKRTMAHFINAGYVMVEQRKKMRPDGSYESKTPIIHISKQLFIDLGIDIQHLMFHVERAQKRHNDETSEKNEQKKTSYLFDVTKMHAKRAATRAMKSIRQILRFQNEDG